MPYVEFTSPGPGARPQSLGKAYLRMDGSIDLSELPPHLVRSLQQNGIQEPMTETRLYPKDGARFLHALPFEFKSVYLTASKVQD